MDKEKDDLPTTDKVTRTISEVKSPAERMAEYRKRKRDGKCRTAFIEDSVAERLDNQALPTTSQIRSPTAKRMVGYRKRKRDEKYKSAFAKDSIAESLNNEAVPSTSQVKSRAERMVEYRKRRLRSTADWLRKGSFSSLPAPVLMLDAEVSALDVYKNFCTVMRG